MSIIIGIVTNTCGLVASDGRILSGAYFENGIRTKDHEVGSDEFDKTIFLDKVGIIGSVAGTMKFDNKKIEDHLKEISMDRSHTPETLIEVLSEGLRERLESVPSDEIGFAFRKIDLILINTPSGLSQDLKIQATRFYPNTDSTAIVIEREELFPKVKGQVAWKLFGDDSSQKQISKYLNDEIPRMNRPDEKNLRSLLYKAIRLGIKAAEKNKDGKDLNCGGKVFVKSI